MKNVFWVLDFWYSTRRDDLFLRVLIFIILDEEEIPRPLYICQSFLFESSQTLWCFLRNSKVLDMSGIREVYFVVLRRRVLWNIREISGGFA